MGEAAGLFHDRRGPRGGTPLILSSGLGGSANYWRPNLDALAERHDVIAYDHRGTGRSSRDLPGVLTIEAMGDDVAALMDALGIARATVIGHAIGGMAGLALALAHPDRVERLVVVNGWAALNAYTARCFDTRLALLRSAGPRAYLRAQPIFLYPPQWIADRHDAMEAEIETQLADLPPPDMIERRIAAARRFAALDRLRSLTVPTLLVPPAFAARMGNTIDSISHGRFGLNLITGWQPPEYTQMGMWPGDEHFRDRYRMLDEYAQVLRALWDTGTSDLEGRYYRMDDCRVWPRPEGDMKIICAGSSDEGLAFSAKWADYAFCLGKGVNTPIAFASNNERLAVATAKTGRNVQVFVLMMVIADDTDAAAMAKWRHYNDGVDTGAIAWLAQQGAKDTVNKDTNVRQLAAPEGAVNINMGTLVGSYESVARMLDEMAAVPGTGGVLLTFDEFEAGVEAFGTRIQPLMKSRAGIA